MTIYGELESLTAGYGNYAYFCRFDRETRTVGTEKLFLSRSDLVMIHYGDAEGKEMMSAVLDQIPAETGSAEIPVFIGFDFINYVFPDLELKPSGWPAFAYIIPDRYLESSLLRKGVSRYRPRLVAERDSIMEDTIDQLKARIRAGEVLQVVISRDFPVNMPDRMDLLREFVENDSSLYVYYYNFGEYEIIGSSPENMVSLDGNVLTINPIAGTRGRGADREEDEALAAELASDPKEQMEHRMLVDLARNDLGKISVPGSVKVVMDMRVQKFSSVQHLVSTVQSRKLPGVTGLDVIMATFPAGTVSGAPKKRAVKIISQYEKTPRGAYSGCIGIVGRTGFDLALIIRSVFGISGKYNVRAGAGIVKDSDPVRECMEIFSKAMAVIGGIKNESPGN
ncbi:MAG: anthranilate synthase component I family protein [Thermoplasmataceae archaeon]